ncbi:MAG: DUF3810 family protein [Oscillospiraceae bacterium]|nr:DUF3810 family protein [Oscillospiraceae bacterium]
MKYWRGYLTAAIFGIITWVLMAFGSRFTELVDMVYPYVIRTAQTMLAEWSSGVDFLLWQLGAIVLLVLALASLVLMIVLKWNPIQWFGWVLAVCTFVYMIHTAVFGLNYYAGPLPDDIRMEIATYNADELEEAAIYYRDHANALADQVNRDEDGNVKFSDFKTLANQAGDGFRVLTYQYSYSIFAGSTLPVKELGWADMYTSMGITGLTMGITGEAAVNPQIPDVCLPFTMCHEMAHRMCIAQERDANFAGFLAASVNPSIEFQYSAYFMAYRYCYNALASANSTNAAAAAARVASGAHSLLKRDLNYYNTFFSDNRNETATKVAATANNTYITASGDPAGIVSYDRVVDLLVNWHIEQVVLPSLTEEEKPFDPLDESQVDLSGIVNAR